MIIVDHLRWSAAVTRPWRKRERWAHMTSTRGVEELQEFAALLGLRPEWFQDHRVPHFDVRPRQHARAIEHGARLMTTRQMLRNLRHPWASPFENVCASCGAHRRYHDDRTLPQFGVCETFVEPHTPFTLDAAAVG